MMRLGIVLGVVSHVAMASGPRQVLTCEGAETGNIAAITGYTNHAEGDVDEMAVELKNGEVKCYRIPPTSVYVEATFPLPNDGKNERVLQWRHTGWFITTYADGAATREPVDCE